MKKMTGHGIKRMLGIILTLCMVLTMVPAMPAYAGEYTDHVIINGQELNSEYKYLVNGVRSKSGVLNGSTCTAELGEEALTLYNYYGGSIMLETRRGDQSRSLTVKLKGNNTITNNSSGLVYGVLVETGKLTITAEEDAKLDISVSSSNNIAKGIDCSSPIGVNITGKARVSIRSLSPNNHPYRIYGIYAKIFRVDENSSLETNLNGGITKGVYAPDSIIIDTTGDVTIKSAGTFSDSQTLITEGLGSGAQLANIGTMTLTVLANATDPVNVHVEDTTKVFARWPYEEDGYRINKYIGCESYRASTNSGSFSPPGYHLAGDIITLTSSPNPYHSDSPYQIFRGWDIDDDDLVILEGASSPIIKFIMPAKDVVINGNWEETFFTKHPEVDGEAVAGKPLAFNWEMHYWNSVTYSQCSLQVYNGTEWERVKWVEAQPGVHTDYFTCDVAGEKTYRLWLQTPYVESYSEEFTVDWGVPPLETHYVLVENGGGSGNYTEGDTVFIHADPAGSGMCFDKWLVEGVDELVFVEGTINSAFAKFTMPNKTVELKPNFTYSPFQTQPVGYTSYTSKDNSTGARYTYGISYEGSLDYACIQVKNGEVWDDISMKEADKAPGFHDLNMPSDTVGTKTFRLYYKIDGVDYYSNEFTINWVLAPNEINYFFVYPDSNNMQPGAAQKVEAYVFGHGDFDPSVNWKVTGNDSENTFIEHRGMYFEPSIEEMVSVGMLVVGEDETAATITITGISNFDSSKFESKTVTIDAPLELNGTVTILGTQNYGEKINVILSDSNNTGSLTYEWSREEDSEVLGSDEIYTIQEDDIGKTLTCEITSNVQTGNISASSGIIGEELVNMYGDVNGDKIIDVVDLISVAKYIAGTYTFSDDQVLVADVNGDAKIDIVDYVLISKYIVGTLPQFPVE
ncbi:dockerin type I repeat-containing protein [Clostridia bacterium]|nr:dockerin type I repeat-containing protein [Clostridia bacterium]